MCELYVSKIDVIRNDVLDLDSVHIYDKIIISPGYGLPRHAGLSIELVNQFYQKKPILGICLGAQVIAECFGAELFNLKLVMHGKKTPITILDNNGIIYKNIPKSIMVGRYHSWGIDIKLHTDFIITAIDNNGTVMSFRHINYPLIGIQYHPESILTDYGQHILRNWLIDA
tara:strand:- start:571 stop:1083 length:513 start_codon:yes stop_codon:yes gene_type:complete